MSTSGLMPRVDELLGVMCRDAVYCTGAQVFVWTPSDGQFEACFGTDHRGAPMRVDHLHSTFCVSKPILPLTLAALVDRGLVNFDCSVGDLVGWVPRSIASVSIRELLTHNAGMLRPSAVEWRLASRADQSRLLLKSTAQRGVAAHSDISAWVFAEQIVEAAVQAPVAEHVRSTLLHPLGLSSAIVYPGHPGAEVEVDRIGVSMAGLPVQRIPMLSELLPAELYRARPAHGALTTASAIGRILRYVYESAQLSLSDRKAGSPAIADLLAMRRGHRYDQGIGRECDFAGGFMCDMSHHLMSSRFSPESFGYSSGYANAFGVLDLNLEVVMSVMLNGAMLDPESLALTRRTVTTAILKDVL